MNARYWYLTLFLSSLISQGYFSIIFVLRGHRTEFAYVFFVIILGCPCARGLKQINTLLRIIVFNLRIFHVSRELQILYLFSFLIVFLFRFALFTVALYIFFSFSRTKSQLLDPRAQIFSVSRSYRKSCKQISGLANTVKLRISYISTP